MSVSVLCWKKKLSTTQMFCLVVKWLFLWRPCCITVLMMMVGVCRWTRPCPRCAWNMTSGIWCGLKSGRTHGGPAWSPPTPSYRFTRALTPEVTLTHRHPVTQRAQALVLNVHLLQLYTKSYHCRHIVFIILHTFDMPLIFIYIILIMPLRAISMYACVFHRLLSFLHIF